MAAPLKLVKSAPPAAEYVRAKSADPLIPYSEREFIAGPYRPCGHCRLWFTFLGVKRHRAVCVDNPDRVERKPRRRKKGARK